MRVHWLQHVPFEGLGSIEPWLRERGYSVTRSRMYAGDPLPPLDQIDWLIVMGGPMNVDDPELDWLVREKRFIAEAIAADKRVLGICLGAQLMARALGAKVVRKGPSEIGWFDVELTTLGTHSHFFADFPPSFEAFHWHGDSFELAANTQHIAASSACRNQAFTHGARVLGLQFHLETTPASAADLITHCADELRPSESVQTAEQIQADSARFSQLNALMTALLARLAAA